MKKPQTSDARRQTLKIESRDEADETLKLIAVAQGFIRDRETEADGEIAEIRQMLVAETACSRENIATAEAALEEWAAENKAALFTEPRSIEMNFGTLGFRWTPWKIKTVGKLKLETILAKIRAAKLTELIRTKEEVDKEKAVNYTPEDLARCGLKKTRKDEFFYEVKKEEVK